MFKVLFITFSGIGLGYLFRKAAWTAVLERSISYTIWLLLLFFGLQVGANELVVNNLDTLGLQAFAIALAGSLGSCAVAWVLGKWVFSKGVMNGNTLPDENLSGRSNGAEADSAEKGGDEVLKGENVAKKTAPRMTFSQFASGFIVVAFFAVGCVCGWMGFVPEMLTDGKVAMWVLYLLMVQVGMSIGSDRRLKEILAGLRPKFLLLPLGTISGTLIFVAVAAPLVLGLGGNLHVPGESAVMKMNLADCMAVGAGFGYYSLSSVLITQMKEPQVGAAFAAQLGTIALMANIMREVLTLLAAPLIYKVFGRFAPISVGGATSMDSTLPVITAVCGKEIAFVSIFHGVTVDFTVPFLVTFFASL